MLFHHGSTNGHYIKSTFRKTIYYILDEEGSYNTRF